MEHGHAGPELGCICGAHDLRYAHPLVLEQGSARLLQPHPQQRVGHVAPGFFRGAKSVGEGHVAMGKFSRHGEDVPHPVAAFAATGQFAERPGEGASAFLGVNKSLQVCFVHVLPGVGARGAAVEMLEGLAEDFPPSQGVKQGEAAAELPGECRMVLQGGSLEAEQGLRSFAQVMAKQRVVQVVFSFVTVA